MNDQSIIEKGWYFFNERVLLRASCFKLPAQNRVVKGGILKEQLTTPLNAFCFKLFAFSSKQGGKRWYILNGLYSLFLTLCALLQTIQGTKFWWDWQKKIARNTPLKDKLLDY